MAHLSFLQHLDYHTLLQYNHIYIVTIGSNAHSLIDLIEASKPRYLDSSIPPEKQALQSSAPSIRSISLLSHRSEASTLDSI